MKNYKSLLLLFLFVIAGATTAAQAQRQRFVANASGAQQVPAVTTSGRGVCTASLNSAETEATIACDFSNLSSLTTAVHIHGNAAHGATAPILFNLNFVTIGNLTVVAGTVQLTAQQVADLRANRMYVDVHTANNQNGEIRGQFKITNAVFNDYDGDGRTDLTVFRPSEGTWYSLLSSNNSLKAQPWGLGTDLTSNNADFDGDGISDYAAIRVNPANGQLITYILQSRTNTMRSEVFGSALSGDQIGTGDFDGDGKYDLGVFRGGLWIYIESSSGATRYFNWGQANDIPTQGDFDRDGKSDFAVVRTVGNQYVWYVRQSSNGQIKTAQLGQAGDGILNRSDFDADGASDFTIIRAGGVSHEFVTIRSSDGQTQTFRWGLLTDRVQFGDFDGDGKNDYAVTRIQNNLLYWYIFQSSNNQLRVVHWGMTGDR